VLGQDPDSDRFAGAEREYVVQSLMRSLVVNLPSPPLPQSPSSGQWTIFTGDQLGSLFASFILDIFKQSTATSHQPLTKLAMVASIVSSKMIEAMAQVEGFKFVQCLTGFKYIGNTCLNLVEEGYEVPFGYEEAIGFMFGDEIRDKDGVAATVRRTKVMSFLIIADRVFLVGGNLIQMTFVQLVAALNAQGKTLKGHLQNLYEK